MHRFYVLLLIFLLLGCNKDSDTVFPALIVAQQAIAENDVGPCLHFNKIQSPRDRERCIGFYVKGTGDVEACNLLSFLDLDGNEMYDYEISSCQFDGAAAVNDSTICSLITYTEVRDDCYVHFADIPFSEHSNHTYCLEVADISRKDHCLYWSSRANPSQPACDAISNITTREQCLSDFAYNTDDAGVCSMIDDLAARDSCLISLIDGNSTCEEIIDKNACHVRLLDVTKDSAHCEAISYEELDNRSKKLYNILCQEFKDPLITCMEKEAGLDAACLRDLAIETGNWTLCALSDAHQVHIDSCYLAVSQEIRIIDICEQIQDEYRKGLCLEKFI